MSKKGSNLKSKQILSFNLYKFREKEKLSIEALALNCALSTRHFGNIERGQCNTSLDTLDKISKGTNITVAELLTDYREKDNEIQNNKEEK